MYEDEHEDMELEAWIREKEECPPGPWLELMEDWDL